MATSSVIIAGATYSDVPSVTLKDTSNADVSFILTSDADATASDIRKNKIAYANGQKIVGDYELNLQEKTVNSSTSSQVITADSGYLVNQDPLSGSPYGGNYQIQYNDVPHSATLVDGEKYRFQVTATTNGAAFTYDEVLAYTWGTVIHSFSLKTDTPVGTLSSLIFTYRQYADGETDCTLKTLDSSVDITDSVVSLKVSYVYDGLSQVTINPYTLGTKVVTPTTSTQVITPVGDTTTCINEQNQQCQYVMTSSRRQYINLTWIEDLVVGETYHFYIVFDRRSYGGTQYYFVYDSDAEFTGFPMSFRVESTTSTRTDTVNLSATELYRNGVSDDDGTNYMTLVVTKQGESYDGLSQVTVNPIPSEYVVPTGTLAITQNGTVNVKNYEYANVNVEGGGGGTTADESLPVRFLDYDGTVVYSYTAEDFANLTAMPSNPSHTGLTAQGWNWSLADAKAQVAEMGECDIGQMYITDDGKTRIYVELDEYTLHPYLSLGVNGTVEIDWGDGSSTDTLTGTSLTTAVYRNHEYSSSGKYIIKITVVSGTFSIFGTGNGSYLFRKGTTITKFANASYLNLITAVELGNNVNLGNYALAYCYSLETITIPNGMSFGTYAFEYCYHLKAIMIPSGVTNLTQYICYSCRFMKAISIPLSIISIGTYAFEYAYGLHRIVLPISITSIGDYALTYCSGIKKIILPQCTNLSTNSLASCYSLQHVIIPDSIITIGASALQNDYSLSKLTIPSGVTSIGSLAFDACYSMKEYHILPTTPPTLASTNVFRNIQSDCKIYVPSESLEAYKTATNWSTYANYMVGE